MSQEAGPEVRQDLDEGLYGDKEAVPTCLEISGTIISYREDFINY